MIRYGTQTAVAAILAVLLPVPAAARAASDQTAAADAETPGTEAKETTTVTVTGKAAPVVHKIDRSVYDVKDTPQAQTGTVADLLNTLPAVNVSPEGAVTVRGQGDIQILIDGKPSPAMTGASRATTLQTQSANTIGKVEVITNPGAEFRSDSGVVINIITKKARKTGASADAVFNAGPDDRNYASLSGNIGLGRLTLNGGLSYRTDNRYNVSYTERIRTGDDGARVSRLTEDYTTRLHFEGVTLDAGASYLLSETDTLSLTAEVSARRPARLTTDLIRLHDAADRLYSDTLTHARGPSHQNDGSATATWRHTGDREGESFVMSVQHSELGMLDDRRYAVTDTLGGDDSAYRRLRTSRQLIDGVAGDYTLPLDGDRQLTAGFDIEVTRLQSRNHAADLALPSGAETVDPDRTNTFLIEQTLSAGYLTWQRPLGRWQVKGGLRVENMLTRIRQSRPAPYLTLSDVQWSPSLYFSRTLSDTRTIRFSYAKRIERPEAYDLNPLVTDNGGQDIFAGNPYLKPGQVQSFEAGYDYTTRPLTYSAVLYYRHSDKLVSDYSYFVSDTVLLSTRENAGDGRSAGASLSWDAKPSTRYGYSLNADIFYSETEIAANGEDIRQSGLSYIAKAGFDYRPREGIAWQISAQAYGPSLTGQGRQEGGALLNLSYSRQISPRLKLVVTGNNVFDSVRYDALIATPTVRDHTVIRFQNRTVFVGLSYRFGAIKGED